MDPVGSEEARYPWQEPIAPIWPASKLTPAERRRHHAGFHFAFEHHFQRGYDGEKKLCYDEAVGFYRFAVGPKEGGRPLQRVRRLGGPAGGGGLRGAGAVGEGEAPAR